MDILCQLPVGFEAVLAEALAADGLSPGYQENGLLVVRGAYAEISPASHRCISNSFAVLRQARGDGPMGRIVVRLLEDRAVADILRKTTPPRARTFRIVAQDAGALVSLGSDMAALAGLIERRSGLTFAPRQADVEYWLIRRGSGRAYLARRLSKRAKTEKTLQQGELRPELAALLCVLSAPKAEDVALDPFCGTGALPLARAAWPYNMIFASDADPARIHDLKQRAKETAGKARRKARPFIPKVADALTLTPFDDGFIDTILTDPPWGLYDETPIPIDAFYARFFTAAARVLKPDGRLILLTGAPDAVDTQRGPSGFTTERAIDTLVNGKPATAFQLRRG